MSIKKTIGRVFPLIDSDRRKQMVEEEILNSIQYNNDVVNLHRNNLNNVGDYFCGPHHYFEELKGKNMDISSFRAISKNERKNWIKKINQNSLIIGGGGIAEYPSF